MIIIFSQKLNVLTNACIQIIFPQDSLCSALYRLRVLQLYESKFAQFDQAGYCLLCGIA